MMQRGSSSRGSRSGYVLADALAGLAILAAGLAAFLGCMSHGHRLMARARDLHSARIEASWQLSQFGGAPVAMARKVSVQPYPGPVQLARAGAALCTLTVGDGGGDKPAGQVRTIRFCAPAGGAGR